MKIPVRVAAFLAATLLPLSACGSSDEDPAGGGSTAASTPSEDTADDSDDAEDSGGGGEVAPLPFNTSGLLGGNAKPNFPDGDPGVVSVVQVGPLDTNQGILLFAFRNNTSEGISHVDWAATARSGGKIISTGSSQGTEPAQVQPGEVGLGYIFFENSEAIPKDAEYEFTVETSEIDTDSYNTAPLKVTEASLSGDAIVGGAVNETGESTDGPYSVGIYCFAGDELLRYTGSFTEQDGPIEDGGTATFTADLYSEKCTSFVVGVSGYFS